MPVSTCLSAGQRRSVQSKSTFQHDWAKTVSQGSPSPKVYFQGRTEMWEIIQQEREREGMEEDAYARKPPKYKRFIRPTFQQPCNSSLAESHLCLPIHGTKENLAMLYTTLSIISKGTGTEVNGVGWALRHKEARLLGQSMPSLPTIPNTWIHKVAMPVWEYT